MNPFLLATLLLFALAHPSVSYRSLNKFQPNARQHPIQVDYLTTTNTQRKRQYIPAKKQFNLFNSLISPNDYWSLWSIVAISGTIGQKLEATKVGKALSGPVCSMLVTAVLTNINVLPEGGSIYMVALQKFVVELATPLLLLGADLVKILRDTGAMLKAFLVGTIGTMVGATLGYALFGSDLIHISSNLDDSWKMVSSLTAKNIGGGLNFIAVADILKTSPFAISTGLTIDNIMGLLYFPMISWLSTRANDYMLQQERSQAGMNATTTSTIDTTSNTTSNTSTSIINNSVVSIPTEDADKISMSVGNIMSAITIGLGIVSLSSRVGAATGVPSIALSSVLTVAIATFFSQQLEPIIEPAQLLGKILLILFFGAIGNSGGNILQFFTTKGALSMLGLGIVLYSVHIALIITISSKLLKVPMPEILLASNANIGNAATASALAASMGWQKKVLPAILVGTLGNFIGTFVGAWLGSQVLQKMMKFFVHASTKVVN